MISMNTSSRLVPAGATTIPGARLTSASAASSLARSRPTTCRDAPNAATWSTPGYQANFEPAEENVWSYVLPGTRDIVIDRACSKSYIAILEPEARQKVIDDLDEVLKRKENFTWIDEEKGIFEYPYQTFLYIARKK